MRRKSIRRPSTKCVLGIDPGITGGIALLGNWELVRGGPRRSGRLWDMPSIAKSTGKGNQVDQYALCFLLNQIQSRHNVQMVYLEQVHAMPNQGVSGVFSFGRSLGVIEAAIAAYKIPVTMVTPQKWKKHFKLTSKDKDKARTLALQRFPQLSNYLSRKKDIGRADALLIALYGWENE